MGRSFASPICEGFVRAMLVFYPKDFTRAAPTS